MLNSTISLNGGIIRNELFRFNAPIYFSLEKNEHLAIVSENGSGKTILVKTILGECPLKEGTITYNFPSSDAIEYLSFYDAYGNAGSGYYYQQRWNSWDRENIPTVSDELNKIKSNSDIKEELYDSLDISPLLNKEIILLSSVELRKFQIVKKLLFSPAVLIIENPYIGLDEKARKILDTLLNRLTIRSKIQIILVLPSSEYIPPFITHVYTVQNKICGKKQSLNEFKDSESPLPPFTPKEIVFPAFHAAPPIEGEQIADLHNVTVRYKEKTILNRFSWHIRKGEKWALTGPNGSGKSTLLSLICADNPQSYACDITLFGRKRGTGESIWDIKKHIGYISSEMHHAYKKNITALQLTASGFFDSIGLYRTPDETQLRTCEEWLRIFNLETLKDRPFPQLSSGEQRMFLLARAFVKNPDLLILNEPLNGLDRKNRERATHIIQSFAGQPDKTLIYVTHYPQDLPACITHTMHLG